MSLHYKTNYKTNYWNKITGFMKKKNIYIYYDLNSNQNMKKIILSL